jgi:hypothetical protein
VTVITRLRLDAALYRPAPARRPGQRGRSRLKGPRLPTLSRRLKRTHTRWQGCWLTWYGGQIRRLQLSTSTAVWYHSGKPPVAIRWVPVRDPKKRCEPQAFLSTDLTREARHREAKICSCVIRVLHGTARLRHLKIAKVELSV